jgi:hypothetical protein
MAETEDPVYMGMVDDTGAVCWDPPLAAGGGGGEKREMDELIREEEDQYKHGCMLYEVHLELLRMINTQ